MFPKLSEAKVKGGIFTGPQIRQMLGSKELEGKMTALERDAWQSFRNVVHGFLGRNKQTITKILWKLYCKHTASLETGSH